MEIALLDLSDSNVQLWHGERHIESPGYALLQDGAFVFGARARAAARLRPRETNTRYWWQLGTDTLQPALGAARHTADLAHAQLLDLHRAAGEPAQLMLAVPGSMQREQLSLLLGIVQQCPFEAVGLSHRSVVVGSLYTAERTLLHLEIQLHQALLTELARGSDDVLTVRRTVPLPGCGILQLQERQVAIIAAAFVRQTRFDPRRKAATEQQLYDALPAALAALAESGETVFELNGYRARIILDELRPASAQLRDGLQHALRGAAAHTPLLTDPVALLPPDIAASFPALQTVPGDAVRRGLEAHRERLLQRGEALSFVTALPVLGQRRAPVAAPEPSPAGEPTHLLEAARARPLLAAGTPLGEGCELFSSAAGWQLRGDCSAVLINDRPYDEGQSLHCGDTIRIGAQSVLLIAVGD